MVQFRIKNLSNSLSSVHFEVRDEKEEMVYQIKEPPSSFGMKLVRLTKFRLIFSLTLEIMDSDFNRRYLLMRKGGLISGCYQVLHPDRSVMISIKEKRVWRGFPFIRREILDGYGRLVGWIVPTGIGPKGSRSGVLRDVQGEEISRFEWKRYSLIHGYRECLVYIYSDEEWWRMISIVSALIKGLSLHHR